MRIGLNAGFGEPIGHELPAIASYGFTVVRQDLFATDPAQVPTLIAEFAGAPVAPLFLVGGNGMAIMGQAVLPEELAEWTADVVTLAANAGLTDYALEIGNEPDIAHYSYSEAPEVFADAIGQCRDAARAAGFTGPIISGGISNLNSRGFDYLARALADSRWPSDVVIGCHRYPETGRLCLAPHDRFRSRVDEWDAFMAIVGWRQVAITETGYHTATEPWPHATRTDEQVALSVIWDLNFYADHNVTMAVVFQLNDGPNDTMEHRYGVRQLDGTWKLVAEAIRAIKGIF